MFCPNCGYENNDENKFCMGCGRDIRQETEAFKKDNSNDIPEDKAHEKNIAIPDSSNESKIIETEPGVCPDCGYHNNISSYKCIKCGKQLKEDSPDYLNTPTNSYSQTSNNSYIPPKTEPTVSTQPKDEEFNYALFSSDYKSDYKYKMLNVSLGASIGGAILVILACFMPYISSYSLINLNAINGIIVISYMGLAIIFSILKYQKATLGILISIVLSLFSDFINYKSLKEQYVGDISLNLGFYLIIIGCVAMGVGLFLSYKDYWDKTTKIMRWLVYAITIVIWVGSHLLLQNNYSNLYNENSAMADIIIPGVNNGMSKDEVFGIVGDDYDYDEILTNGTAYYYDVDSVPTLNCDIPAVMYFFFNKQDKLYAFSYDIGVNIDTYLNGENKLNYSEDELIKTYDEIYDFMKKEYNVSWTDITNNSDYLIPTGTVKAYLGSLDNSNDKIFFTVGAYNENTSVIAFSCQNESFF